MTSPATKLHEILAVEGGLQAAARKINEETVRTLNSKDAHFIGTTTIVKFFDEGDAEKLNTEETKAMVTTVGAKLDYNKRANVRAWDAYLQKESANQNARADIEVDGKVLASGVPGVVLLGMETKLAELRAVYEAIPTLAPGPNWQPDPEVGKGVFRAAEPEVKFRTKKIIKGIELSPATKEHPAQVQAASEDVVVAKVMTHIWSGMLSGADKSAILDRLDKLLRAVKRARQRANEVPVENRHFGESLFSFIHGDTI